MKYETDIQIKRITDNCPANMSVGHLECNVELELDLVSTNDELGYSDFEVLKVYIYDDATGEEYALKTDVECKDFYNRYRQLMEQSLDDDDSLINQIIDYLEEEQYVVEVDSYLDSRYFYDNEVYEVY